MVNSEWTHIYPLLFESTDSIKRFRTLVIITHSCRLVGREEHIRHHLLSIDRPNKDVRTGGGDKIEIKNALNKYDRPGFANWQRNVLKRKI